MARHDNKQIGGRSYDPVQWDFQGDRVEARKFMGEGRQLLGELKRFISLSPGVTTLAWRRTLQNGVLLAAMSIFGADGMADQDFIKVIAPPASGGLLVYGYTIEDFGRSKVIPPSGKEFGHYAKVNGKVFNPDKSMIWNTGYPGKWDETGGRWITFNQYRGYGASYSDLPENEQVFQAMSAWFTQVGAEWRQTERPPNWEVDFPFWPVIDTYPTEINEYLRTDGPLRLYRRLEAAGIWGSDLLKTDDGYEAQPSTAAKQPDQDYDNVIIALPGDFDITLWDYVYSDPFYVYTEGGGTEGAAEEWWNVGAVIVQGEDLNWYEVLDEHNWSYTEIAPGPFHVGSRVEEGPNKIYGTYVNEVGTGPINVSSRVTIYTSRGKLIKYMTFRMTAPPGYVPSHGSDNNLQYEESEVLYTINVGEVASLDDVIKINATDKVISPPYMPT